MAALPVATPVTSPVSALTVAMFGWAELQLIGTPAIAAPFASRAVAVSSCLAFHDRMRGVGPTTPIDDALTCKVRLDDSVPRIAVMVADPGNRAVTAPVADTPATASSPLAHETAPLPP